MYEGWLRTENPESGFLSISRIHTMEPQNSENLDQFLQAFKKANAYIISAAYISSYSSPPETFTEFWSLKRKLSIRQAWR